MPESPVADRFMGHIAGTGGSECVATTDTVFICTPPDVTRDLTLEPSGAVLIGMDPDDSSGECRASSPDATTRATDRRPQAVRAAVDDDD
jgi:hypothetical protein